MKQDETDTVLVELALLGLTVIRLKGGDSFVFGWDGEEIQVLEAHGIPYEAVPDVTSAMAVPECAGIPVIHHGVSRNLHVIIGHTRDGKGRFLPEFETYGSLPGTLVFSVGLGQLPVITARLIEGGVAPDTPVAIIENGTLPGQRAAWASLSGTHARVMEVRIGTPIIIVMGETAPFDMECDLKCRSFGPLAGYRVDMVGTRHFANSFGYALKQEGVVVSPVLEIKVMSHIRCPAMQKAYRNLATYTWLIFTSANGMRLFFQEVQHSGMDHRLLGHTKFAVIGNDTDRRLANLGFHADYMSDPFCVEALARGLTPIPTDSDHILIAHPEDGSPILTSILEKVRLVCDNIVLYQAEGRLTNERRQAEEGFGHITFASASDVRACLSDSLNIDPGQRTRQTRLVCVGDITVGELEKHGIEADTIAGTYHIQGLVQAIADGAISREVEGPALV